MSRAPYNVANFSQYWVPSSKRREIEVNGKKVERPPYTRKRIVPKEFEEEFKKWGPDRTDLEFVNESDLSEEQIRLYAKSAWDMSMLPIYLKEISFGLLKRWREPLKETKPGEPEKYEAKLYRNYVCIIPKHLEREYLESPPRDDPVVKYVLESNLTDEENDRAIFLLNAESIDSYTRDPVFQQMIIDKYGLEEKFSVIYPPGTVPLEPNNDNDGQNDDGEDAHDDVSNSVGDDESEDNVSVKSGTYSDGCGDSTWEKTSNDRPESLKDSVLRNPTKYLELRKNRNYKSDPDWASKLKRPSGTSGTSTQFGTSVCKKPTRSSEISPPQKNNPDSSAMQGVPDFSDENYDDFIVRSPGNLGISSSKKVVSSTSGPRANSSSYTRKMGVSSSRNVGFSASSLRGDSGRYTEDKYGKATTRFPEYRGTSSSNNNGPITNNSRGSRKFAEHNYYGETTARYPGDRGNSSSNNNGPITNASRGRSSRYAELNYSGEATARSPGDRGNSSYNSNGPSINGSRGGFDSYTERRYNPTTAQPDSFKRYKNYNIDNLEMNLGDLGISTSQNVVPSTRPFTGGSSRHAEHNYRQPASRFPVDRSNSSSKNDGPSSSGSRGDYSRSTDQDAAERRSRNPILFPRSEPLQPCDEDWETPVLERILTVSESEEYRRIARKGTTRVFKIIDLD